jgi:hypothetical protein
LFPLLLGAVLKVAETCKGDVRAPGSCYRASLEADFTKEEATVGSDVCNYLL